MDIATPELDKLKAVSAESQKIGEFLEWCNEQGWLLASWTNSETNPLADQKLTPVQKSITQLLGEYFEIDMDKVEEERQSLLAALASLT